MLCSLLVLSWGPSSFLTSSLVKDVQAPLDSRTEGLVVDYSLPGVVDSRTERLLVDSSPVDSRTERLVVDTPPSGVDFTGCREEGGLCCLSYVSKDGKG